MTLHLPKDWSTNDAIRWLGLSKRRVDGANGSTEILENGEVAFCGELGEVNEYLGRRIAAADATLVQGEMF